MYTWRQSQNAVQNVDTILRAKKGPLSTINSIATQEPQLTQKSLEMKQLSVNLRSHGQLKHERNLCGETFAITQNISRKDILLIPIEITWFWPHKFCQATVNITVLLEVQNQLWIGAVCHLFIPLTYQINHLTSTMVRMLSQKAASNVYECSNPMLAFRAKQICPLF